MVIEHEIICTNLYLSAKQNYAAQHRNVYLDAVSGDPYSKLVYVWLEVKGTNDTKSYFLGKLIQKHWKILCFSLSNSYVFVCWVSSCSNLKLKLKPSQKVDSYLLKNNYRHKSLISYLQHLQTLNKYKFALSWVDPYRKS